MSAAALLGEPASGSTARAVVGRRRSALAGRGHTGRRGSRARSGSGRAKRAGGRRRGADGGDPDGLGGEPGHLAAVAPALGDAVAAHVDVAAEALGAGAGRGPARLTAETCSVGLGYVTLDRDAAAAVERALAAGYGPAGPGWTAGPPPPLPAVGRAERLPRGPGVRPALADALDELEPAAGGRGPGVPAGTCTVGLACRLAPGPWGIAAGVARGLCRRCGSTGRHLGETGPTAASRFDAWTPPARRCCGPARRRSGRWPPASPGGHRPSLRRCSARPWGRRWPPCLARDRLVGPARGRRGSRHATDACRSAEGAIRAAPAANEFRIVGRTHPFTHLVTSRLNPTTESDDARARHPVVIFGACPDG